MIVAYILTNKYNQIKIVFKDGEKTFTDKNGFVYNICSDRIYFKKFLRLKFFRFSQYNKGIADPIDIEAGEQLLQRQKLANINYLAVLLWRLKKLIWEKVSVVLLVILIVFQVIEFL